MLIDWDADSPKLRTESDRLFGLHKDTSRTLELYHREAQNLTVLRELYWASVWQEYQG